MERIAQLQTNTQKPQEFSVGLDTEGFKILESDPEDLLDSLFENKNQKVFLLKGTGFSMDRQLQSWGTLYKEAIEKNTSLETVKQLIIQKTIEDVVGFYFEYLTKQDILPIRVEFKENEEKQKIVWASHYQQTLESLAKPEEREGALSEGVKKTVEILTKSGPETVVVLVSPHGWSGMKRDGKEVVFPNTQTYVYWINKEGDLDAITIRTDINLGISEKLVQVDTNLPTSTKERIKKVVSSPRKLNANSFEEVLDLIEEVSGCSFSKQRSEIINRSKLFTLNDEASLIVKNLKEYLDGCTSHLSIDNIRSFVIGVGKAILDLAKQTLPVPKMSTSVRVYNMHEFNHNVYQSYQEAEYNSLYEQVRAIVGCNGGGKDTTLNTMIGSMSFAMAQMEGGITYCPVCNTKLVCGHCSKCDKIRVRM